MLKRGLFLATLFIVWPLSSNADNAQLRRGAQVVVDVCNGCHSLKYLRYTDLLQLGFTQAEVTKMQGTAGEYMLSSLSPADAISAFKIEPPDLSLMAKAREGGPRYIDKMITGFYTDDKGQTQNRIFPGIKMPDVFMISQADATSRKVIEAKALDVSAFLEWASDPLVDERKSLGRYVIGYLVFLTLLLYLLKRKIWAGLKP